MDKNIHDLDKEIAVLQKECDLKFEARDDALLLKTEELARRLEILNGEATRLRDIQATYLPREVFEQTQKETGREIGDLKDFKNTLLGKQSMVACVVSVIVSLAFLLLSKFLNQ